MTANLATDTAPQHSYVYEAAAYRASDNAVAMTLVREEVEAEDWCAAKQAEGFEASYVTHTTRIWPKGTLR